MQNKTWIEISKDKTAHNIREIKSILTKKTKLYSVVKSNAYGHGIFLFSKLADKLGVDGFCVDSVVEGLKLRKIGIKKPILVLGPTLSNEFIKKATKNKITITASTFESLRAFAKFKNKPEFHLKIDTGMHRQGIYKEDLMKAIKIINENRLKITGYYTHFAAASHSIDSKFSNEQYAEFMEVQKIFQKNRFNHLTRHISNTGGTFLNEKYHFDLVRVGIGLYGLWPSENFKKKFHNKIPIKPILSWKSVISEVKDLKKGDKIGYDLTETAKRNMTMAIVPVGYWHGIDKRFSRTTSLEVKNRRARILGSVSMDLIAIDVTGIRCKVGETVTIIGEKIRADDLAKSAKTINYEIVTRINPLIERILV